MYDFSKPNERLSGADGGYIGTVHRNGREFHAFQFLNVLIGKNRPLIFLIDVKNRSVALRESAVIKPIRRKALLLPSSGPSLYKLWEKRDLQWFEDGVNSRDPAALLRFSSSWREIKVSMIIHESNGSAMEFHYKTVNVVPPGIDDLRWRERNRILFALRQAQFIATISLDVIWLPCAYPFWFLLNKMNLRYGGG